MCIAKHTHNHTVVFTTLLLAHKSMQRVVDIFTNLLIYWINCFSINQLKMVRETLASSSSSSGNISGASPPPAEDEWAKTYQRLHPFWKDSTPSHQVLEILHIFYFCNQDLIFMLKIQSFLLFLGFNCWEVICWCWFDELLQTLMGNFKMFDISIKEVV